MYKKFEQETAMGDNIFLKEMKEIQFEDYFKYDAKCRGNLGDELPVMVYRMLEYSPERRTEEPVWKRGSD